MTPMTNLDEGPMVDAFADAMTADAEPQVQMHTLRQSGGRPLTFSGAQLAMAMNYVPGAPFWYEINIFRLSDGRFVFDVRNFRTSADEDDSFHVFEAATFDELMSKLEGYDAADDVCIDFDLENPSLSVADLTFHAMALRIRVEEARRRYRSLVGQVLYELNQSDM